MKLTRFMPVLLAVILVAGLLLSACARPSTSPAPGPAGKREPVRLDMQLAEQGTLAHTVGFHLADIISKKHEWLRVSATATPGSIYNAKLYVTEPQRWANTIYVLDTTLIAQLSGEKADEYKELANSRNITTIAQGSIMYFHTLNPNIRTLQDLAGKRVALGTRAQVAFAQVPAALLKAVGVLDKAKVEYLGADAGAQGLLDGVVDASIGVAVGGMGETGDLIKPTKTTTDILASGRTLYYVGAQSREDIGKTIAAQGGAGLVPRKVTAGSLPGQKEDFWSMTMPIALGSHKSLPDDVAYEFTKAFLENYKELWEVHPSARVISPSLLGFWQPGKPELIHPGAVKAFREYARANPGSVAAKLYEEWGYLK